MKKLFLLVLLVSFQGIFAQKAEVQKSIETFFKGFHARDTVTIKSVCAEKIIMQSISESEKGKKFRNEEPSSFMKMIATIPLEEKFEERILSYNVQIDGSMAHVWTPYEFYIDGKFSHRGVNSFQVFKEKDIWKIIYVVDTRRK